MSKATIRLTFALILALCGAPAVHARGFGGAHAGGGGEFHASGGEYHAGGYSAGGYHESGSYGRGSEGAAGVHHESSGEVYHGADGATVVHGSASTEARPWAPAARAAGGREVSGTAVKGPDGNEYTHESSAGRGVAAGPEGAEAGRYGTSSSTYHSADGASYEHGVAGYSSAHAALPTDAGFGASEERAGAVGYAGYHGAATVNGSVYAARGVAVRSSFNNYGLYGAAWHTANPGAWHVAGWRAGYAWTPCTWASVGVALGWAAVQPFAYNYGSDVTYQDDKVYYGTQPVATADQYYQQAAVIAQSSPPPADASADQWMPLGVFAMVQKEQSDPNYIMQLAVNKSGAIAGNYSDIVSGTNVPIQGAVDKKTQRAAWTVGSKKSTVCETGIYNLTQDEAPMLLHLGKDKTQQWLLVRLKQPQAADGDK